MISKLSLPVLLLATSVVTAGDRMPKAGSYGFNWLDPQSSCKKLSSKKLASIKKCTASNSAFGLRLDSYVCRVNNRVELMVYKTAASCKEALETMQANGP